MKKKIFIIMLVVVSLVFVQNLAWADEKSAEYLLEYYDISFDDQVDVNEYNAALSLLETEKIDTEELTLKDAVVGAVRLANLEEFALSYENEAQEKISDLNISVDEAYVPYVYCAVTQGLVDKNADFDGPVSGDIVSSMIYRAAEISGKGRHYIGRLSDNGFLTKLNSMLQTISIFNHDALVDVGIEILLDDATTGFSLKYAGNDAKFLEENTLRYGHDNIIHLVQLAALVKAEGFDAYVQIEPKVSVYEYMLEWGEPGSPTPTYEVLEIIEGRYFAFALEYDMVLEFDTVEQKEDFHRLVETYAKKYDDSFDEDGNLLKPLLASSFWQPLYYSLIEMENDEYMELIDNEIAAKDGYYSIHSISLPENVEAISNAAARIDPDMTVTSKTIYTNPAFYRYISGIDHQ